MGTFPNRTHELDSGCNSRELLRQLDHLGSKNGVEVEPENTAGVIDRVLEDAESEVEEVIGERCFEPPRGPRPVHRLGKGRAT